MLGLVGAHEAVAELTLSCAIHTWQLVAATAAAAVRIAAAVAIATVVATLAKAFLQTHGRRSLSKLRRW